MTSLGDPLELRRGPALPNRLALAPMTNTQSHPDGTLSDDEIGWLVSRARGGFGHTMTAAAYVTPAGQAWAGQLGVSSPAHLQGLARLAREIHDARSVSAVQLHHGGLRANPAVTGMEVVGPFDDAETGARALSTTEVQQVIEDFAAGAARVEQAGIDGVELHGANGYLLCQFLDPVKNLREDGYGGDYAGRTRIFREVIMAIRACAGPEFQLGVRVSAERHNLDLAEMVQLTADLLASDDVDYIDVSLWDVNKLPAGAQEGSRQLIDHFVNLPRNGTALGFAGKITGAAQAQAVLDRGADAVVIGKAAIIDQSFASRVTADPAYVAPEFPVTREQLRAQQLAEPFVEYFANGWPHLIDDDA